MTDPSRVTDRAAQGCDISGLHLEGARWELVKCCLTTDTVGGRAANYDGCSYRSYEA